MIEKRALTDIQKVIDYYDEQSIGLGEKFNNALDKHIAAIVNNQFSNYVTKIREPYQSRI